jgi:hypothetical protein
MKGQLVQTTCHDYFVFSGNTRWNVRAVPGRADGGAIKLAMLIKKQMGNVVSGGLDFDSAGLPLVPLRVQLWIPDPGNVFLS